jgi:hypothetical protein
MPEAILTLTPADSPTQSQTDDISLLRAALFGAVVPPVLATAAFLLVQAETGSELLKPFVLFFFFLRFSLLISVFCGPFGIPFAVLCGFLARTWVRRGDSFANVQARLSSVGAMCGLVALWGVGMVLHSGRITFVPPWPLPFWGAALVVGAICGWFLPRMARISRPIAVSSAE